MACRLALKAAGRTSPNPIVGAVLVKAGKIIATGFHPFAGADHGEIVALKRAGKRAKGATLYVNLEPCSHYGRTPPCTRAIIAAGITEVVAGMKDPNALVGGKGLHELRRAGIRVRSGILQEQCKTLNEAFTKYITCGIPFVTLKLAASLDGKIATASGDARWISSSGSRLLVHQLRNQTDAVIVGAATIMADDPQLTCRIPRGRDPFRIILDGRLRMPLSARLLRQRGAEKNIVITGTGAPRAKVRALEKLGAKVWQFPERRKKIPWRPILEKLATAGIVSVLLEGGATTAAWALRDKVVDKLLIFFAPKIIGGDGLNMVDTLKITRVKHAIGLRAMAVKRSGTDLLVSGYL
jgi:diaminohydroxyphosphoribosylaminopyrimidine deaminase / 5-amino-6-(5-phosphoribosylamino)uracil reductase